MRVRIKPILTPEEKAAQLARHRTYYQANRERIREGIRKRLNLTKEQRNAALRKKRVDNPEFIRSRDRVYASRYRATVRHLESVKVKARERVRKYKLVNPEKVAESRRRYEAANKARLNEYRRLWKIENRETRREKDRYATLRRKYGIARAEFDRMRAEQGNKCAVCRVEFKELRFLHVDHDHELSVVRGLLCLHCNCALGHAKDSIERLEALAEYLRLHAIRTEQVA